jgi:transposase
MKKVVRQIVGIDVAQDELVVCLGRLQEDFTQECYARKSFANTPKGFDSLTDWVARQTQSGTPVRYVMEATGVYHESLAYYLEGNGHQLSIILPNKISNFFRTLDVKTVTDQTAAEAISLFGLSRTLNDWRRPKAIFKKLRQLTRERNQIIDERTVVKNQMHAEKAEAEPSKSSLARIRKRMDLLNRQEKEIRAELTMVLDLDQEVKNLVMLICTIPGVGMLTAISVLAETNGFELIRNKRQLTSYAGLDVREKQSGTSVKGKPKISKRGNKYLRKAMHMPALAAIRHDERYKAIFARLVSKHGIKMKAVVAVQRKLLEMMFTVFKKGSAYDKQYLKVQAEGMEQG